jgi:hypothetical protein
VQEIVNQIKARYKLLGGTKLQWFLGIKIIHDQEQRLIWLSQKLYIKKIISLTQTEQVDQIPMSQIKLLPYSGKASYQLIQQY